ncbi:twitching motility protein PilT [Candidatus Galacturonibacter soehngenii]|uniref:Twitching motility protein PilT n=1 Tax=Candidatus Galacturonatibacter soehngenii TaxID=2307010 RepID=A0A7V7UCR5_9FIRM|nr:twitching motility protein PilT [Candidatus Galacturonibacter soehngenii]KAB1439637.1 twitching motility protein PilT [Candidatus Galacturonibacter soehngenii]
MISLIVGKKGKGKTKLLLNSVNNKVKSTSGNIVYLDKSTRNIHELSNKVRLINVLDYPLENCDEFIGFICGIISQDYDLEEVYLDSFLKIAHIDNLEIDHAIEKLSKISEKFKVNFTISVSDDESNLTDMVKSYLIESL